MMVTRWAGVVAATALAVGGVVAGTTPVAEASGGCPVNAFYAVSNAGSVRMPFKGIPTFKNGPGGHVAATRAYGGSVSYNVTAGAEAEVSGVFVKAKATVSASLTKTNSTETTITYSHKIPKGKYGNLRYVAYGKKINWKKQIFTDGCKIKTLASGSINFPTNTEGWYYWTTNS